MSATKEAKKQKKRRPLLITVLSIAGLAVLLVIGGFYYLFSGLTITTLPSDDESLGISEQANSAAGIENIALFGVDARDGSDSGRSDAIIILSVDKKNNEIKMTSILRDSKVPIEGHGETKINHAYAYGGPGLAIKTLNQNFRLDIKEYVTVNFEQMADLVDAVGSVTIPLSGPEVSAVNEILGRKALSGKGEMALNGEEAVAYARIRSIDSDNARAGRQQNVLNAILTEVKSMPKSEYPRFIRGFLSTAETSLNYGQLLALSPVMLGNLNIVQNTIPDPAHENPRGGIGGDCVWYWTYDLDAAADRLHTIVYGS